MHQPRPTGAPTHTVPSFYLTGRQPLRPGVLLLAVVTAAGMLFAIVYAMSHTGRARLGGNSGATRSANGTAGQDDDDKDDPNQIDTIVLGDPGDAPVPGRRGDHVSPVHPTIVVRLPRFGDQVGLIPNTPSGQLLYKWLAAFNRANPEGLNDALPSVAPDATLTTQLALRRQTGGFNLLSAKEVVPGVLVFRLLDQTPSATEVLGTLQVQPNSNPAIIASFSLRAVPSSRPKAAPSAGAVAEPR